MEELTEDEFDRRFIAILNKKIDPGKLMNALGHISAGLSKMYEGDELKFLEYKDASGEIHSNISHYGFIVLKADNSNKIRKVRNEAKSRNIPFTDFTSTMTVGTTQDQLAKTAETKEEDLEYFGICMFGDTKDLKEFTSKFSLYQ